METVVVEVPPYADISTAESVIEACSIAEGLRVTTKKATAQHKRGLH